MNQPSLTTHLSQIISEIPPQVRVIAVSKTVEEGKIRCIYATGMRDFAENKLQEALEKQAKLSDLKDITWHFIGHLQSNKAKKAIESFPWIHSVDSLKIAEKLNRHAEETLQEGIISQLPQICLQVKILPDESKFGWEIDQLWGDLDRLKQLKFLRIRGLMVILPLGLTSDQCFQAFEKASHLKDELQEELGDNFDQLSMGMSGDYLLAIKAGATMIRLGTIIFGKRN
ncbi:MAG: YggS family pyridoxal phosphate-dependent enzyme [Cyanobacterium sp. T60_A2020_053]|nr:YggS family pyridoxal phosphate-dependent enzyme [Cyanobacterium sp. T60_A2020_053]